MFKVHNGFSQVFFLDLFHNYDKNNVHNLRSQPDFQIANFQIKTTLKIIECVRYFGAVIWNNIFVEIRILKILKHLKKESENGSQQTVHVDYVKLI